ncbi:MAG: xanthine dehydrogenase family protein molybdopterin-binding subunit [Limisphaerales bacterium]
MNDPLAPEFTIEPERYEFFAEPPYHFDLARRDFFKVLGGGILILLVIQEAIGQEAGRGRRGFGGRGPQDIGGWLHIAEDGAVTAFTGKVELGQNIRTSLTQVVAEELHAPLASIRLVMGDTALTPFDMGTFGSMTTPTMAPQLRRAAAAARELLRDLAAEAWKVDRTTLVVADGKITSTETKQSFNFGQLTKGQKISKTIAADAPTTPAEQWKTAGKSIPKVDGRAFVTGRHKYTSDVALPGLLVGKVLRPPALNATLASVNTRDAAAMPGVKVVHDGDFVGVTAPTVHAASEAIKAVHAEWNTTAQPSGADLYDHLKKHAAASSNPVHRSGSIPDGLAAADEKLERTYTIAYIAHAPLEPRAAVAQWTDGKLTVWFGTQRPFGARSDLARAFRIGEDQVRVIVPDTGAGYGGKQSSETAVEAARLAHEAGKPVKVVWSREEEFRWAYFRPAGVIDVTSGVRRDGTITAWEFHNYNSGGSAIRPLYDIPNQLIEFHSTQSPLRQGSYRGLAATANHFARESHIDELAHAVKMDPLEFRLKNLKDARQRKVLEAAAEKFGWGKEKAAPDRGFGIACGFEKNSYVATCAEIAVNPSNGRVKVVRAVSAFDCGAVVNPDHLRNQIEGCLVMGLGGALFEAVKFDNGKILNARFSQYRLPRFSDAPAIEVVLVDRKDIPSAGAGETPIVGIAPAVGNAIFAATGVRLSSLPMVPDGLKT